MAEPKSGVRQGSFHKLRSASVCAETANPAGSPYMRLTSARCCCSLTMSLPAAKPAIIAHVRHDSDRMLAGHLFSRDRRTYRLILFAFLALTSGLKTTAPLNSEPRERDQELIRCSRSGSSGQGRQGG